MDINKWDQDDGDEDIDDILDEKIYLDQVDLPETPDKGPCKWSDLHDKQLRSALLGACKRMPHNSEAHFHLGLMHMRTGKGEDALRAFAHSLHLCNERLNSFAGAAPPGFLQRIARLKSHTAQAAHIAARDVLGSGDRAACLPKVQQDLIAASAMDPLQPDIWNALALLYLNEGGFEAAIEVLNSILDSFPTYFDALNNLGLAELSRGSCDAAIKHFQTVILHDRDHAEALTNYGVVLLRKGMFDLALKVFQGAVEGAEGGRGMAFAWGGLAVARVALGQLNEAEEAAAMAEKVADAADKSRFSCLYLSMLGRRATWEMRRGIDDPKVEPGLGAGLSVPAGKLENIAVSEVTPAPQPEPQSPPMKPTARRRGKKGGGRSRSMNQTANDEAGMGDDDSQKPALEVACARMRNSTREIGSAVSFTGLGTLLRIRHEFSTEETGNRSFGAEAAERFVESLEKDPSLPEAWAQLALLQMGSGEYTSSRDFALQAVCRDSTMTGAWNSLAVASMVIDELPQAEKAFGQALDAIDARVQKNGGIHDIDGAFDSAAVRGFACVWNNYGNLCRQQGRLDDAEKAYDRSVEAGGECAEVWNNRALLEISRGNHDQAMLHLDKAAETDPYFECIISNKLKLERLDAAKDGRKSRR